MPAEESDKALFEQLTSILRESLADPALTVRADTRQEEVEGWDSYAMLDFIFRVEAAFEITFKGAEMDRIHSVRDVMDAIRMRR